MTVKSQSCQETRKWRHLRLAYDSRQDRDMAGKTKPKKSPTSPEIEALGARILMARMERRMHKSTLENAAGIATGRVTRLEKGKRVAGITADAVIKIANALGVEPGWLLTGRGEMWAKRQLESTGSTSAE